MEVKKPQLNDEWLDVIGEEFNQNYMKELKAFLSEEKKQYEVYPPGSQIFYALNCTPLSKVKVVILGQDPYHGRGQAHGLCFSVNRGVTPPPSLKNIYKEIHRDLGIEQPDHGDLSTWAEQGVLMLNTTLTVRASQPRSHANRGWETFTDAVIQAINDHCQNVVFVLWGKDAKNKSSLLDTSKHLILSSTHPSPFSAHYGFMGCGHFGKINEHLNAHQLTPIDWQLPA